MSRYFRNIAESLSSLLTGMGITFTHMLKIKKGNVTSTVSRRKMAAP